MEGNKGYEVTFGRFIWRKVFSLSVIAPSDIELICSKASADDSNGLNAVSRAILANRSNCIIVFRSSLVDCPISSTLFTSNREYPDALSNSKNSAEAIFNNDPRLPLEFNLQEKHSISKF